MSTHKQFLTLCANLGVAPSSQPRIAIGDTAVRFWADIGSKNALRGAIFSVPLEEVSALPAPIVLRREGSLDRFGKVTQINRELQTQDEAFDRAVYIESDLPDEALHAVLRSGTRGASAAVLAALDASIELSPTTERAAIQLKVPVARFGDWPAIRAALVPFVTLPAMLARGAREDLEASGHDPYGRARSPVAGFGPAHKPRVARGIAFALGLLAVFVVWMAGTAPATLDAGATLVGLGIGTLLFAGVFVLLSLAFRGRSTSLRVVILFAIGYLMVIPFFGFSVLPRLNAFADRSAGTPHDTVATQSYGSKGSTWLDVSATWRPNRPQVRVPLNFARGPIPRGQYPARVTTRAGAFGWEWISDVSAR